MEQKIPQQSEQPHPPVQDTPVSKEPTSKEVALDFYTRITKRADIRELLKRLTQK